MHVCYTKSNGVASFSIAMCVAQGCLDIGELLIKFQEKVIYSLHMHFPSITKKYPHRITLHGFF